MPSRTGERRIQMCIAARRAHIAVEHFITEYLEL
jgi:hypothetical protein